MTYESLNDIRRASLNIKTGRIEFSFDGKLKAGDVEIWYAKNPTFMDDFCPSPENIYASHAILGTLSIEGGGALTDEDLEHIYHLMQGEIWSPKGEARNLIRAKGLHYTSMSVGDCVRAKVGDNWHIYMVANLGWKLSIEPVRHW